MCVCVCVCCSGADAHDRLQFFKADGSGFFAQHPQSTASWYEVDTRTGTVYGYSLEAMSGAEYILKVLREKN